MKSNCSNTHRQGRNRMTLQGGRSHMVVSFMFSHAFFLRNLPNCDTENRNWEDEMKTGSEGI
jgi:hypothetical protein